MLIFFCLYSPRTLYILENILEYTNTSKLHEPHGDAGGTPMRAGASRPAWPGAGAQREEQHVVEAERERGRSEEVREEVREEAGWQP